MIFPFDNPLFLLPIITGPILIIVGYIMLRWPPKNINALYGYRTKSSMKSQERWGFAQQFSAKEMIKVGFYYVLTSVLAFFQPSETTGTLISLGIMIALMAFLIYNVETAIKNKFKNNNQNL